MSILLQFVTDEENELILSHITTDEEMFYFAESFDVKFAELNTADEDGDRDVLKDLVKNFAKKNNIKIETDTEITCVVYTENKENKESFLKHLSETEFL